MKARRMVVALTCVLAMSAAAAAQDRGKAKAEGRVLDEAGQPLADVIVAAVMEGFDKPFQQAKTNRRGEWSIDNLAAGKWKIYFGGVTGLEEKGVDIAVAESGTVKVEDVTLGKPFDHMAFVNGELQRAADMMKTMQPAEARKVYEGLLEKYPQIEGEFRGQLHGAVAQTYAAENQPALAAEHLKKAVELDPKNTDIKIAYGELLLQAGQREEAERVLLAADMSQAKDPFPYMNIVITRINEEKVDEALELLARLMKQFPDEQSLYYYRGRAHLAAKKLPEAKADLEKFVAAASPDARELPDAKKILEQLKDAK